MNRQTITTQARAAGRAAAASPNHRRWTSETGRAAANKRWREERQVRAEKRMREIVEGLG